MALIAADTSNSAQGIVKVFNFATTLVDNADTFVGPTTGEFWINNNTDGVVVSATRSSGTYTFTVAGAGINKDITLFVVSR